MPKLSSVGPLRLALAVLVIVLIGAAFFADGKVYMHDWRLFPSVIAPSVVTMILFVLPLDITMTWVFKASTDLPDEQRRLAMIIKIDCLLFALLIFAWLPFIMTILNR
jgi:hypothetical protein